MTNGSINNIEPSGTCEQSASFVFELGRLKLHKVVATQLLCIIHEQIASVDHQYTQLQLSLSQRSDYW